MINKETGIRENVACVNTVMDFNKNNSSDFGKLKPKFSKIY